MTKVSRARTLAALCAAAAAPALARDPATARGGHPALPGARSEEPPARHRRGADRDRGSRLRRAVIDALGQQRNSKALIELAAKEGVEDLVIVQCGNATLVTTRKGEADAIAWIGLLAAFYSFYLIYTGLPVLMRCPPGKAGAYTAV